METILTLQSVQKVIGVEELKSTRELARELAPTENHATLVLACCQTAACTPNGDLLPCGEGGVYFTLILKPAKNLAQETLSRALENAFCDTFSKVFELKTKKNAAGNILVWDAATRSYKKIALVTAEQTTEKTYLLSAVVALNNRLSPATSKAWTSLKKIIKGETSKELFLDAVLDNFWKEYAFI